MHGRLKESFFPRFTARDAVRDRHMCDRDSITDIPLFFAPPSTGVSNSGCVSRVSRVYRVYRVYRVDRASQKAPRSGLCPFAVPSGPQSASPGAGARSHVPLLHFLSRSRVRLETSFGQPRPRSTVRLLAACQTLIIDPLWGRGKKPLSFYINSNF